MYFFLPVPCIFSEAVETLLLFFVHFFYFLSVSSFASTRVPMNPAGPGLKESSGLPLL